MSDDDFKFKIDPEQLHDWYLESLSGLDPDSYNPNAKKPYDELSDEQKLIDQFIADKINKKLKKVVDFFIKYKDNFEQFVREHPEEIDGYKNYLFKKLDIENFYKKGMSEYIKRLGEIPLLSIYNDWLFSYCFLLGD